MAHFKNVTRNSSTVDRGIECLCLISFTLKCTLLNDSTIDWQLPPIVKLLFIVYIQMISIEKEFLMMT